VLALKQANADRFLPGFYRPAGAQRER